MAADPSGLFEELRRRKVFRATAAYVVVAAGVGAVASDFFPALGLPDWTVTLVVALVILGLPVTIALSWAFDVRPPEANEHDPEGKVAPGRVPGQGASAERRRWTARRIAVVGAVVILALAGGAMLFSGDNEAPTFENRIAVLPFENHTGEPELDALGAVAAEWISDGLTGIDKVQAVPATEAREVLAGAGDADPLPLIRRSTGAGLVVAGSYVMVGDSVEIRTRLVDVVEGAGLVSFDPVRSPRSDPTAGLVRVRDQVMGAVAARLDYSEYEDLTTVFGSGRAPTYLAYRAYITGMELFAATRYTEAIPYFDRAFQADSTFWMAPFRVAVAYGNLGQSARMDSVLSLIDPHRAELSEAGRIALDWAHASLRGDLAAAYRFARRGYEVAPGSVSRYLTTLYALLTNRPREAVELLKEEPANSLLRKRWIYYHRVLARAFHVLGQHDEELEVAREARAQFPDLTTPVFLEAQALAGLGRPDGAEGLVGPLLLLSSNPEGATRWILDIGDALAAHGHEQAAARLYHRALDALDADGPRTTVNSHYLRAQVLRRLGRLDEAAEQAAQVLGAFPDNRRAIALVGRIAALRADRPTAERIAAELAARDGLYADGGNTYERACIRALLGDRDRAVELLRQAHAEGHWLNRLIRHDPGLRPLDGYPPFEELIRPKG